MTTAREIIAMSVDAMIKHHQAVAEVITHAMSDYASAATGISWNKACFAFEADAILCALSRAGFRVLGPDEVDAVTLEEVEAQAEQIMLDVANEWHRQIGIDEVLKSKLVKRIADTVATGVFSRALRALASGESR